MENVIIYFEVDGFVGGSITLGQSEKRMPYEQIVETLDVEKLKKTLCLTGHEIKIMTPEEYEAEYGEDD